MRMPPPAAVIALTRGSTLKATFTTPTRVDPSLTATAIAIVVWRAEESNAISGTDSPSRHVLRHHSSSLCTKSDVRRVLTAV